MSVLAPPEPPQIDDPEALIPEARDRQRRRRLIGAAAIAVAAILGLGIYAFANGARSVSTFGNSLGLGHWPDCRSSQLKTEPVLFVGTLGAVGGLGITNTSGSSCSLPAGAPRVTVLWQGQPLAVNQIHIAHPFRMAGEPVVHVLGPGKSAQIDYSWRNWCGPPKLTNRQPETLRFRFGQAFVLATRFGPKAYCVSVASPSTITATRPLHLHS